MAKDKDKKKGIQDAKKVTTTAQQRMEKEGEVESTCVEGIITEPIRVDNKYYFEGPCTVPEDEAEAIGEAVAEKESEEAGGGDYQRAEKEEDTKKHR